ncbi:hypothetical protein N9A87_02115 [Euryarchaeota archaeon]|nr:hypothetical protein [Euryarchaeota archaeon]
MAKRITAQVPVRIDLAGGWSDVPAYCHTHRGEVVNIAIDRYVTATCEVDEQRRMEVAYRTETPTGCGLGTSAAMNVALVAAISEQGETGASIAEKAYQIEAVLGNTGGRQDQWASAFGGVQHLIFEGDEVVRSALNPSSEFTAWLEQNLMLFDTGLPHVSGRLHESIWSRFERSDANVLQGLGELREAAELMHQSVLDEEQQGVASALHKVMQGVDLLDPALHDPFRSVTEPLTEAGRITAWKAMGAGGGGVVGMLQSGKADDEAAITSAAEEAGWQRIVWRVEMEGIQRTETISRG